jgi:hypothetical protein
MRIRLATACRMNEEPEKKESSLTAIILLGVLVVVAWYSLAHGLQTLIVIEARQWASANPFLNETPQPLPPPTGIAPASARIEHFNYQFYVPWKPIDKDTENPAYAEIRAKTGEVVVFFNPDSQIDMLQSMKSGVTPLARNYMQIFAGHPPDSNYALYDAVYSASPAQAALLMPRQDALRLNTLLLWKLSFGVGARPGIYTFDWGGLRGIQFGDPTKGSVAIRAFDNHDRQFPFLFVTAAGSGAKLTQEIINQIVASSRTAY